jgi:hypothetical protein
MEMKLTEKLDLEPNLRRVRNSGFYRHVAAVVVRLRIM